MHWEVKSLRFRPVCEAGLPGEPRRLIVARDVLSPKS